MTGPRITKHPWVKGIHFFVKFMATPFSKGILLRNSENTLRIFKTLLLQNYSANFNKTLKKASLGEGYSSSFK